MIKSKKNTLSIIFIVWVLLTFASLIRLYRSSFYFVNETIFLINLTVYLSLLLWWAYTILKRTGNHQTRYYLLGIVGLIVFWLFVRSVKYQPFNDIDLVARHLWYAYYIPMILIPVLSFYLSLNLGQPENYTIPKIYYWLYVPALVLIGAVLSNDLHQQAFAFQDNFVSWSNKYNYRIFFYLTIMWIVVLSLASLRILFKKSFQAHTRRKLWVPLVVIVVGLAYVIYYAIDNSRTGGGFYEATVAYSVFVIAFWESCMQSGLLPTNTKYKKFFNASNLQIMLVDYQGTTHYQSQKMMDLNTYQIMEVLREHVIPVDKNTLLKSKSIHGGHVLWLEDITKLQTIIDQLQQVRLQLSNEVDLLQQEVETKAKIVHLQHENYLLDTILDQVEPHLGKIKSHLDELETAKSLVKHQLLIKINILGAYIKRRSNLSLAYESQQQVHLHDITNSFNESLSMLDSLAVESALLFQKELALTLRQALLMYDMFQTVLETLYLDLSKVVVSLSHLDHQFIYGFHLETHHSMNHDLRWYLFENKLRNTYQDIVIEHENDHVFHINFKFKADYDDA